MIEVKDAVMQFDGKNALDGISLTIPEGCAYGLLGSNGAGKSTLLRVLSGIYRLNSGEVKIDGNPVYDNAAMKERVFFINDETVQFNNMILTEMKNYYKRFYSSFSEELWQKLYSTLNLPLKKRLNTFSKGMKRQAAVICGIACRTPYLFLDEAFDGLDPTMRIIVKQMLIDAMMDTGLTVIFSSHNLGEIDEFCDRVGLLHAGKVVFDREL
ncbi:MAG: ABC transporter ATP-binding protein, partial [Oscillospiraceae bacterium]